MGFAGAPDDDMVEEVDLEEGRRLGHCVLTYAEDCRHGRSSIWSFRESCRALGTVRRLATLELATQERP